MKILLQRVTKASVEVQNQIVGSIGKGLLVFIGITHTDTINEVLWLVNKLIHLRLFHDLDGKINRSLLDEKAEVLIVSQFTLYADCTEGRRPSFLGAAAPDLAKELYQQFINEVKKQGVPAQTGVFGAQMQVSLINDGPVTLMLEKNAL